MLKKQVKQQLNQNGRKSRHLGKLTKESKHKIKVNKTQTNCVKHMTRKRFVYFAWTVSPTA
jgi:hypothetical protein